MPDPWERLPGEPAEAYAAFCHYRDYGISRKLVRSYREIYNQPDAVGAPTFFRQWSRDFDWQSRILAYDNRLQVVRQKSKERAIEVNAATWVERKERLLEEGWQNAEKLIAKALEMLNFPLATVEKETGRETGPDGEVIVHKTIIHPAKWSMKDVALFLKVAEDIRRLAAGLATSITRVELEAEVKGYLDKMKAEGQDLDIDAAEVIKIAEEMVMIGESEENGRK